MIAVHPDIAIFLDRCIEHTSKPAFVGVVFRKCTIHGTRYRCQKGRLGAGKIVRAICIKDLAVMVDLVSEIVDQPFGELNLPVVQQAEGNEIAVPSVHFVEPAAGDDIRDSNVSSVHEILEAEGQKAMAPLKTSYVVRCDNGGKLHDAHNRGPGSLSQVPGGSGGGRFR